MNLTLKPPPLSQIMLAPMEGIVDAPMRDILTQVGGIDVCVTEFLRVTDQVHTTRTFWREFPELTQDAKTSSGVPVHVQLLGSDPERLAQNALVAVEAGAKVIDLNFGCPAPTVNRHKGGAALLKEPELIASICKAISLVLPAEIPLTAKMRLGYENTDLALDCALAMSENGASQLVVHARTKVEAYRPPAHWEWIRLIKDTVKVPVVANGEVWSVKDAIAMQTESGCDQIMIGRGLLANPFLALQIKQAQGWCLDPVNTTGSWAQMHPYLLKFYDLCMQQSSQNSFASRRLKQWLKHLARHYPQAGALFNQIRALTDAPEIYLALSQGLVFDEQALAHAYRPAFRSES